MPLPSWPPCQANSKYINPLLAGLMIFTTNQVAPGQVRGQAAESRFAAAKRKAQETISYAQGLDAGIWGSPLVVMYMLP